MLRRPVETATQLRHQRRPADLCSRGARKPQVRTYRIAAIPRDGIGKEVVAAGLEVLLACAERDGRFTLDIMRFEWGSERYKEMGVHRARR